MEELNKVEVEYMTDEEVMKYLIEVSNGKEKQMQATI